MKIKRFFAPDMRQAIRLVRDEQGPDAVILSTRNSAGGVEIVAAVDYDAELVNGMFGASEPPAAAPRPAAPPPPPAPALELESKPAAPLESEPEPELEPEPEPELEPETPQFLRPTALPQAPRIEWTQDPMLSAMQNELKSLRAILQDQVSRLATADYDRRDPVRAEIVRRFVKFGFDEAVARDAAAATNPLATPAEAWRQAMFGLAQRLPLSGADPLERGGVIALVGATGVGKTTTAAKLAARACMRYGASAVALISTDDFRVGGQRQLAAFGLLLGLPVRQARSAAELADQLAEFSQRRIVIIDTAGMSQRDLRLIEETRKLSAVANLQSYLVLSANVQREVMDEIVAAFGRDRLAGCILTKLDEAARLGPALSTLLAHRLPVAFMCEGQRVPEDLRTARARDLVVRALSTGERDVHRARQPRPAGTTAGRDPREVRHAAI